MFRELFPEKSLVLGLRFIRVGINVVFEDDVKYVFSEIQALNGKSEEVKRAVHLVKKILTNGKKTPIVKG